MYAQASEGSRRRDILPALLEAGALTLGLYELLFEVGAYFGATSGFLDQVPVRFRVTDPGSHYHIPLIVSPFGYSTYRGG